MYEKEKKKLANDYKKSYLHYLNIIVKRILLNEVILQ